MVVLIDEIEVACGVEGQAMRGVELCRGWGAVFVARGAITGGGGDASAGVVGCGAAGAVGQLLHFSDAHMKNSESLVDLILSAPKRYKLQAGHVLGVKLRGYHGDTHMDRVKNILKEITQRVNN